MSVKCLADDYVVVEKEDKSYVYNSLYEDTEKGLLLAAFLELLLPEASDYYIPICIEIKNNQDNVIVGKKLEVIGTQDFQYFIAKHQYEKWKRTYGFAEKILEILCVLINVLLGYLFWKMGFQLAIGINFMFVLLISIGAVLKLEMNNHRRKKYEIRGDVQDGK